VIVIVVLVFSGLVVGVLVDSGSVGIPRMSCHFLRWYLNVLVISSSVPSLISRTDDYSGLKVYVDILDKARFWVVCLASLKLLVPWILLPL
jgi:hypothetical protein